MTDEQELSAYRARLATAENELVAQEARARKLQEALCKIRDDDTGNLVGLRDIARAALAAKE